MKLSGSCLCKSIKFSFETEAATFGACHCSMCRNWGGGPALAVHAMSNIEISGEQNLKFYNSSNWAERGFCTQCGSHILYRTKDKSFHNFNLGSIDGHEDFQFSHQVYIDNKPENYRFSNETKTMTEKEVLEAFGSN